MAVQLPFSSYRLNACYSNHKLENLRLFYSLGRSQLIARLFVKHVRLMLRYVHMLEVMLLLKWRTK
jgi:hypothetical protein